MHFVLPTPSLQHLAGINIVAHLWNQRDFIPQIDPHSFNRFSIYSCERAPEWKMLTDILRSKARALPLPERCINQLVNLIEPLGTEILYWCHYYNERGDDVQLLDTFFPYQLFWTMHGTVDYAKTAELMVKNERLSVERRFEIACLNCLEDEARQLFRRVTEKRGEEWVSIPRNFRKPSYWLCDLILFFARSLNFDVREQSPSSSSHSSNTSLLLRIALYSGNRAMCEYLWRTLEEKAQFLEQYCRCLLEICSGRMFPTRSLLYYLSLLNEEQTRYVFENCTKELLVFLMDWPSQSLFVEAAQCGWRNISSEDGSLVLLNLLENIFRGFNDYDYSQLFRECWRLCSADNKRHFFGSANSLRFLLASKREEFIKLILNEAPAYQLRALCSRYYEVSDVLTDESCISEAALMECKERAALESSEDPENEEKRLRSRHITRLVGLVTKSAIVFQI